MRGLIAVLLSVMFCACATPSMANGKIRLAQSSTATNCMMACNAQAANCQTACLLPSAQTSQLPNGGVTSNTFTPNATANTTCLSACTTSQITCQTTCARLSPSQ